MTDREPVLVYTNPGDETAEALIRELKERVTKSPHHLADLRVEILPEDPAKQAEMISSVPAPGRVVVFCDPTCVKGMTVLNGARPDHLPLFPAWAQSSANYAVRIGTATPRRQSELREYSGVTFATFTHGLDPRKNKRLPANDDPRTRPRHIAHDSGM